MEDKKKETRQENAPLNEGKIEEKNAAGKEEKASEKKEDPKAMVNGIEELNKQAEEYKEIAQRVQAEFENYKKRMEKRYEDNAKFCSSEILKQILPFLDSIDDALRHMEKSEKLTKEDSIDGMKKLREQLIGILKANGMEEINCKGKFDPERHECVSVKNDNAKDDEIVISEFRKGYTLHGKVIRPSMVEVNKKEENKN